MRLHQKFSFMKSEVRLESFPKETGPGGSRKIFLRKSILFKRIFCLCCRFCSSTFRMIAILQLKNRETKSKQNCTIKYISSRRLWSWTLSDGLSHHGRILEETHSSSTSARSSCFESSESSEDSEGFSLKSAARISGRSPSSGIHFFSKHLHPVIMLP